MTEAMTLSLASLKQYHALLFSVFVNMLLTLSIWIFVYSMKTDENLMQSLIFQSSETQNELLNASLYGLKSVIGIIIGSVVVATLVLFNFKKTIYCWFYCGSLLLLYGLSGNIIYDLLCLSNSLRDSPHLPYIVSILTILYGSVGCLAYFTKLLPNFVLKLYIICNASLVSNTYLRSTHRYALWFFLFFISAWDAFAVMSRYGPLRFLQERAGEYSDNFVRVLMYSCDTDDSSDKDSKQSTTKKRLKAGKEYARTADDALNDGSQRLGVGDYVFYGVLAGASATNGSILATSVCILGVLIGLYLTMCYPCDHSETLPALPLPILLGTLGHLVVIILQHLWSLVF
ncbi:unnamed protein product [Auanema sp. JU1783]|nr:unnamed protein product [Auanema sp. JU1783]